MENYQGEYEGVLESETMHWPNLDEEPRIKTIILSDNVPAKREAICWEGEKQAKEVAGVWMWWTDRS